MTARLYPLFLRLDGKRVFVAGGGEVATRRVERLIASGASIVLQSPQLTERLAELASLGIIEWDSSAWDGQLPAGCALCFAATSDPEVNRALSALAEQHGIPAVDASADSGTAIVPAVIERGRISVAISTQGSSPALARLLRLRLERVVGDEFERLAELLEHVRRLVEGQKTQPERAALYRAIATDEMLALLSSGEEARVRGLISDEADARGFRGVNDL